MQTKKGYYSGLLESLAFVLVCFLGTLLLQQGFLWGIGLLWPTLSGVSREIFSHVGVILVWVATIAVHYG